MHALEAVHERRPQLGGGDLFNVDILPTRRGSSNVDVSTSSWKNFRFFEIYCVSARRRGVLSMYGIWRTRGEGFNFLRFCADIFMDGPFVEVSNKLKCAALKQNFL